MAAEHDMIQVEVVEALPERQSCITINVAVGTTVAQAITAAGLAEIDEKKNRVGIFSRLCEASEVLHEGDRVEIYRPLQVDPKEARRRRAAHKAAKSKQ